MFNISDVRQSQMDRLEDAGIVKYGERANSIPKADQGTLRSRFARSLREVILGGAR